MPQWMLKNADDQPSGTFTFAVISFMVVTVCVLLSSVQSIKIGTLLITMKAVDTTLALGYLAASFSTYVVRRTTTAVTETPKQ